MTRAPQVALRRPLRQLLDSGRFPAQRFLVAGRSLRGRISDPAAGGRSELLRLLLHRVQRPIRQRRRPGTALSRLTPRTVGASSPCAARARRSSSWLRRRTAGNRLVAETDPKKKRPGRKRPGLECASRPLRFGGVVILSVRRPVPVPTPGAPAFRPYCVRGEVAPAPDR